MIGFLDVMFGAILMAVVYLGLGSNLGDCLGNLRSAITQLQSIVTVVACSSILRNKPMYVVDQPDFYNQVIKVETEIPPSNLLSMIKIIETKLGRIPTFRYGPRVIDIDILYYDQLVFQNSALEIPHPRNNERVFILALMAELAPQLVCPKTNIIISDQLHFLRQKAAA